MDKQYYECDPNKYTACGKTHCHINSGECHQTVYKVFAKEETMKKPLMVVLEGPECTGKTTVAQRLADEYSCPSFKRVRTPNRFALLASVTDDLMQQQLRTSVGSGESLIVFDRWQMISDIVYEKYCYGKDSILEPLYPVLAQQCRDANVLVIYMDIDKDAMLRRFKSRGDKLRTEAEACTVYEAYHVFFGVGVGKQLPFVAVDVTEASPDKVFESIVSIINANGGNL